VFTPSSLVVRLSDAPIGVLIMRRAICGFLLGSFILTAIIPAFAQRQIPSRTAPTRSAPVAIPANGTDFRSVAAYSDGSGVGLRWTMAVETQNIGFNVYAVRGNTKRQLNTNLIPGGALKVYNRPFFDGDYQFVAPAKEANSTFLIETVPMSGAKTSSVAFSAVRVGSLRSVGFTVNNANAVLRANSLQAGVSTPAPDSSLKLDITQHSLAPDSDTQKWVASQPGVKLGVRAEGLYKVTKAQLQAAGFDVNSDPANWQLYVDGRQQSINVAPNGDYIEFYGTGIDRKESATRIYFLLAGASPGKRMAQASGHSISTLAGRSYTATYTKKERTFFISSLLNGDTENYFGRVVTSSPTTLTFDLSGVATAAATCTFSVAMQGFTFSPHPIALTLNGHTLDPMNGQFRDFFTSTYTIPASYLIEGTNSLTMASTLAGDFSFFDHMSVTFERTFLAQQNTLSFFTQNYRAAEISGFTSPNVRVFDTTYDDDTAELYGLSFRQTGSTYGTRIPARRARTLFAVENSAILSPATIEQNNPSTLSTTNHNAQLLIISYKGFLSQANDWKNYRTGQDPNLTAEVVDISDVYDEFNYGVLSSDSITSFLQYAKNNWQTPPQYVLLIGDATYDPKDYQGFAGSLGALDYVPEKSVDTLFGEAPSDDALVDFDNDGLGDLAIGRIPARDGQTVTNALNKTINFEQLTATHSLDRGALFVSDWDPNTWDFSGLNHLLDGQLPAGTPATFAWKVLDDGGTPNPNGTQQIVNGITAGPFVVNYSGHGSTGTWASSFFTQSNVVCNPATTGCINNPGNESIFTALTCFNGYFIRPDADGLSESLLKATNGGAVAAWSSTGETTPDVQQVLALRFYQQLGQSDITRLGDLIIDAKLYLAQHPPSPVDDVLNSWVLLGDPMLKIKQ